MSNPFPAFYLTRLVFVIRFEREAWLPAFKGFTFRGALGDALLALLCTCNVNKTAPHTHEAGCRYQDMFKPRVTDDAMRHAHALGSNAPPPLLLNPPETSRRHLHPGDVLQFEVTLIGRAGAYWVHVIEAMRLLGDEMGI